MQAQPLHPSRRVVTFLLLLIAALHSSTSASDEAAIDLGSRPAELIAGLAPGELKSRLQQCQSGPFSRSLFSIGHRGAPLRYPEHTRESYLAAAGQGAGILECDVTFTADRELVCRHSQCDLHTTTNILEIPELAAKCSEAFRPYDAASKTPATARCCTSDLNLADFRRLQGRSDSFNPRATSAAEYLDTAQDRQQGRGTLMTHAESIALFARLGVQMTPELKQAQVPMPWQGEYTRQQFAEQMIREYRQAEIQPEQVWPQSFHLEDVRYWLENEPEFGKQAVYLDSRVYRNRLFAPNQADFKRIKGWGVNLIAPPIYALLTLDDEGNILPSDYARLARDAGLDLITWTLERSDLRQGAIDAAGNKAFYYQSIASAINNESDRYEVLHVLASEVGIRAIFSDWPATVTYYANCMQLD